MAESDPSKLPGIPGKGPEDGTIFEFQFTKANFLKLGLATLAVAGAVAIGIGESGEKSSSPHATWQDSAPLEPACAPPSSEALKQTTALFDAEPYRLSHAPAAKDHHRVIVNPTANFISLPDSAVAHHYGLQLPTYNHSLFNMYLPSVAQYQPSAHTTTLDKNIKLSRQYMDQFGVQLQIGNPGGELDGLGNPTKQELQDNLTDDLSVVTWSTQSAPVQYMHLSGLKKIIFMDNPKSDLKYEYINRHTVVWNINGEAAQSTMDSVVYTGIDMRECGVHSRGDPGYTALNPDNIYGPAPNHNGLLAVDRIYRAPTPFDNQLGKAVNKAFDEGNDKLYCNLIEAYDYIVNPRTVVYDPEGFESATADKIALGRILDWPANGYSEILDPRMPVVRAKALFLLARLYQLDPNIVKYFAGFSGRPDSEGGIVDCNKYTTPAEAIRAFIPKSIYTGKGALSLTLPENPLAG